MGGISGWGKGPHFSPHSKGKSNYKSTNLRKIGRFSTLLENPSEEDDYETEAKKVMVDFKFDALYRYVFIESLLKSG